MIKFILTEVEIPFGYASAVWREHTAIRPTIYESFEQTSYAEGSCIPLLANSEWPEQGGIAKSVVLVGSAGIGKTTWACQKAEFPMMIITHIDTLKTVGPEVKTLIFDDMDFRHWPRTAQIQLVDRQAERSIHVRYGTATIARGVRVIFLSNEYPFARDSAIDRRTTILNPEGSASLSYI